MKERTERSIIAILAITFTFLLAAYILKTDFSSLTGDVVKKEADLGQFAAQTIVPGSTSFSCSYNELNNDVNENRAYHYSQNCQVQ